MQKPPIVSVLMTAFDREAYIAEAIESVLASTYRHFELIIVDDTSRDRTVDIARAYEANDSRIKVFVNKKNLGDYPNRNVAASYASGKYIKYIDSDDIMYPHCLEVMVKSMEKFPDAGFGLSSLPSIKRKFPVQLTPEEAYLENFNGLGHFLRSPGSAIIKLAAFKECNGFSGKRMIGDNELWFKLARKNNLVLFQRDLIWHRYHEGQESQSDYSKKYDELRREVISEALSHQECPIDEETKKQILRSIRKHRFKTKFKNIFYV